MLEKVNISHLEEDDKAQLLLVIKNIANIYNKGDEKDEVIEYKTEKQIYSNIIVSYYVQIKL